jgi:hypothetical protein
MADNSNSKDKALEALDFIINVLKEHEESLDKSIDALATITEQFGDPSSLNGKVEKIEAEINGLQNEVANLIGHLPIIKKETQSVILKEQASPSMQPESSMIPSLILGCKQWEDFQILASHAQTLSFDYNEADKVFQVNALKGNQIITYRGNLPNFSIILKAWLSVQLAVTDQNILEGFLEKK